MKIVLRSDVPNVGNKGDLVEVADGYARNYLVPKGLAMVATKGAAAQAEAMRRSREAKARATRESAHELFGKINGKSFSIKAKAGDKGRLFGSITASDVAAALSEAIGRPIDRRDLEVPDGIKSVGQYEVTARLHADVSATFTIEVSAA